ncbi:MAG: asparaginase [Clostridia bacterium]|nr:asparaginase [Clostridia bacterium]
MIAKKICLLHTGGTIGMIKSERGYTPREGYLETLLESIPDLSAPSMPYFELVELEPLIDSSNMSVSGWNKIAREVADRYDAYDGFVILHGTDTMAYTASALSFMLDGLSKPVILTGSQIPLCEVRSDGRDNLITSLLMASDGIVNEVALYFGGRLLRGNRSTKMSADGLLAFDSPNYPYLATAGIGIKYNKSAFAKRSKSEEFSLRLFEEIPIGVLKVFPGMSFTLFDSVISERLKGIVLETFGSGNVPSENNTLLPIIKKAFDNGAIVTVCSQCPQGTVALGAYASSSPLKAAGAVSGFDMTTEAAVAKLYYLFSMGYSAKEIKSKMEKDLRGELS